MSDETTPVKIHGFNNGEIELRESNRIYNGEQVVVEIVPIYGADGLIELSGQAALALANHLMERATIRHIVDDEDNLFCKMLDLASFVGPILVERGKGPLCQKCKRIVEEDWLV